MGYPIDRFEMIKNKGKCNPFMSWEYDDEAKALKIVNVDSEDELHRCSVCGKIKPREQFTNDGTTLARTNCKLCRDMPYEEMKALSERFDATAIKDRRNFSGVISKIREYYTFENTTSARELIEMLQKLNPETRIHVGCSGDCNSINEDGVNFEKSEKRTILGKTFEFVLIY